MYRSCIFCSADLKANEALERFPVGRSVAFDGAKGRLWAICPKCARWNLAPIEERWETVEEAERLFRDTRTRVQSENVGLARLRDGTRLVRVGAAVPGELAAWRYGGELGRRRRQYLIASAGTLLIAAVVTSSPVVGTFGGAPAIQLAWQVIRGRLRRGEVRSFPAGTLLPDRAVLVDSEALRDARLLPDPGGGTGFALRLSSVGWDYVRRDDGAYEWGRIYPVVTGSDAHAVLRRGLVNLNASGAGRAAVARALGLLAPAGAAGWLQGSARDGMWLVDRQLPGPARRARLLALEMALHEETERRALEGELAALEEMWRQAEEVAAIADRLPDDLHSAGTPRMGR